MRCHETWDGGGDGVNWSDPLNWDGDATAPAATGDTLIFGGVTGLSNSNNSQVSSLINGGITFAAGAGAFTLSGSTISWETDANGVFISNLSSNDQILSMGFNDPAAGTRDRTISPGTGRTITFGGNINFGNDRISPSTTAGTIVINGNNTGDGTVATAAGTNWFRTTVRNDIDNTQVTLGSNTALGNAGTGTFAGSNLVVRGLVAQQTTSVRASTPLDLSAYGFAAVDPLSFNGTNNITVGYLMASGGNRDVNVNNTNLVTVASGIFTSLDQTARQLNHNMVSGGNMVVNGQLYNTLHSGGITTQKTAGAGGTTMVNGTARFQGTGTVTLNGDSSTTFAGGEVRANSTGATIKLGHANAMGSSTSFVDIDSGSTLDLNGFTISQTFLGLDGIGVGGNGRSRITALPPLLSAQISKMSDCSPSAARATSNCTRVFIIRQPSANPDQGRAGTLILSGSGDNTRYGLIVNGGQVNLNKSGADRAVINNPLVLMSGTAKITGGTAGTTVDQINNADNLQVDGGTFDLNGRSEVVNGLNAAAAGGIVTNTNATAATLFVGGGPAGTGSGSYAGFVQDGIGTVSLAKQGSGTQTLAAANTYSGSTTISGGNLTLAATGSIDNSSSVNIAAAPPGTSLAAGPATRLAAP